MRENKLKRMIKEGKPAIGTLMPGKDPDIVQFIALLGYDFYFIDGEHGGIGAETAGTLVRAAQAAGIEPVVRAPSNDPAVILGYLEAGAYNIVVPHCSTANAVRRALAAIKYPPQGMRGSGSSTRAASFGLELSQADYIRWANEQTLLLPMLEEPEAFDNLGEILSVQGLEAVFIGPGDLSLSMGYGGQWDHPAVQEKIGMGIGLAKSQGIAVANVGRDAAHTRIQIERGCNIIISGAAGLMASACRKYLKQARLGR
ncbi:MAG: aldolase/citrate lyase family protein [Dehalococcoidia bacterium]|nr:aldolase/citrate lyase family protein [Dehalococcoidia bacterium]